MEREKVGRGWGSYFSGIVKAYLAGGHGGGFVEVGPGGVDYGDVIFFVAWRVCEWLV